MADKEYIAREAATTYAPLPKELREYQTYNLDDAFEYGYDFAIQQIDAVPAANVRPVPEGGVGEMSDGYHTFNGLYYQRMVLFVALVKAHKDKAWKSWRHEDGELCFGGGWFIVGIDTPEGSYTYHYEDKDWDRFDCEELPVAKHWDGHTEKDVTRLLSLDVRPVVRAAWQSWEQDKPPFKWYSCDYYGFHALSRSNYCPNCGAKMTEVFEMTDKELLQAYKDTGLGPEEIKAKLDGLDEFQKLEAEGRLVVLPCKLREPIFRIEMGYCDWRDQDMCAAYCDGYDYACPDYHADKEVVCGHFTFFDASRFGKTVFLSREEAEAKLKEAEEND